MTFWFIYVTSAEYGFVASQVIDGTTYIWQGSLKLYHAEKTDMRAILYSDSGTLRPQHLFLVGVSLEH
jgi:hypothetical protein